MGRKSKLTDKQWMEIERRLVDGEARRPLAKEFGISEGAIRLKLATRVDKINEVTNQLVSVHENLKVLPLSSQLTAQNNAAKLIMISNNLAQAAISGSETAAIVNQLAAKHSRMIEGDAQRLNETATGELTINDEALKTVMKLSQVADQAARIPLNLLAANKERINNMNIDDNPEETLIGSDPIEASKAYIDMVKG